MIYRQNEGVFGVFKDRVLYDIKFIPEVLISDNINGEKIQSILYGPSTNKKDIISDNLLLPKLNLNDWIWYPKYGAYSLSLTSVDIPHKVIYMIKEN